MPIHIENVSKRFGNLTALQEIDLFIGDGEFVSLVGPSGCGKSTLLAIIAGLDTATTGNVFLERDEPEKTPLRHPKESGPSDGEVNLFPLRPRAATAIPNTQAGVVFQEPALFPWRTIRDNVAFGLEMRNVGRAERLARAEDALKMVHLSQFAGAFPHELSGGMRQRAAIARALITDPPVLLMDEPFAALDAQTRTLLQVELLSVWERTGKTVVFVTHGLDEALTLSDRIVLMTARPGRILADLRIDAPRPRDPQTDPSLRATYNTLRELLAREVESVARAEHDGDWTGITRPAASPAANLGAEI